MLGQMCSLWPDQAVVASLEPEEEALGGGEVIGEVKVSYDYLLSMPIASLTLEKVMAPPRAAVPHHQAWYRSQERTAASRPLMYMQLCMHAHAPFSTQVETQS